MCTACRAGCTAVHVIALLQAAHHVATAKPSNRRQTHLLPGRLLVRYLLQCRQRRGEVQLLSKARPVAGQVHQQHAEALPRGGEVFEGAAQAAGLRGPSPERAPPGGASCPGGAHKPGQRDRRAEPSRACLACHARPTPPRLPARRAGLLSLCGAAPPARRPAPCPPWRAPRRPSTCGR